MMRSSLFLASALGAFLATATTSAAPSRQLDGGWVLHPAQLMATRANVACGQERAAIRSWHGDVQLFDGSSWTAIPGIPGQNEGRAYGDAIAMRPDGGEICTEASGRVACWDGQRWSMLALPDWRGPIGDVLILASGELLVTGRGRVGLRIGDQVVSHDAGTWRELGAIAGSSLTDLWTAGQGGTVMRRTGTSWTRLPTGITATVDGLAVESPTAGWAWGSALGGARAPVAMRWDGASWRTVHDGLAMPIHGIAGPAARPWASSDSTIWRFDGTRWASELESSAVGPDYQRFGDICATRSFVVVANGGRDSGAVVHAI